MDYKPPACIPLSKTNGAVPGKYRLSLEGCLPGFLAFG
jgi:hypothetical protein